MMVSDVLVVIDLQNGVNSAEYPLADLERVLDGVNQRIAMYRDAGKPVIFVQHVDEELVIGSDAWALMPELDCRHDDIYVNKTHANSFFKTELPAILAGLDVEKIEFCGAQTEYCVDTTVRFAHGLGFDSYMVRGLHTTADSDLMDAGTIMAHHESLWDKRFLTFL
ncbi:cysteine hydrolase family protein [Listeria newyorkensis]|uniref:Cysteine hydrolase n=1 Tax=Listeria newyorkensis TaxID=1497681 RepID=A0A841YU16_9LIST|nr:cysteine hydrolase family protein [Listeria newyorkensis]MBC1456569.1 cysteine hydrolase [Listeria newyorkensis]